MSGIVLPKLELGEPCSPFDEAVILINGHEEETIRIECAGALDLADRLIRYVNAHAEIVAALTAARNLLSLTSVGDRCEIILTKIGAAA